jgi:hypothetical protein
VNISGEEAESFRVRVMRLTCIAGLAGLPQMTVPVGTVSGCPAGLSLIGWPGGDEVLLDLAVSLARRCGIVAVSRSNSTGFQALTWGSGGGPILVQCGGCDAERRPDEAWRKFAGTRATIFRGLACSAPCRRFTTPIPRSGGLVTLYIRAQ